MPQARAKKISVILVKITCNIPFIHPLTEVRGVPNPLKRLEGVRYPLRSNEGVEANPSREHQQDQNPHPLAGVDGVKRTPLSLAHPSQGGFSVIRYMHVALCTYVQQGQGNNCQGHSNQLHAIEILTVVASNRCQKWK